MLLRVCGKRRPEKRRPKTRKMKTPRKIIYQTANKKTHHSCYLKRSISYLGSSFSTHPGRYVENEVQKRRLPQQYKMTNGELPDTISLVFSVADESFQANYFKVLASFSTHPDRYVENEDQKRRPCSNLPEMTRGPQKTIGMLCLATLRSSFYIVLGVFVCIYM